MLSSAQHQHLCKVTLLGNLVEKPNIRYTVNPVIAIAEIKLATNSKWYDKQTQQYKTWTSYHTIKVIGDIVEQSLLYADKGDIMLVHGYLLNSKKTQREIIHANFAQLFEKGYTQSINTVQLSGKLVAPITLRTTEQNKLFAEGVIEIAHQVNSMANHQPVEHILQRPIHLWGKQATYLAEKMKVDDDIILEGQLSYLNNSTKSQYIDVKSSALIAKKTR